MQEQTTSTKPHFRNSLDAEYIKCRDKIRKVIPGNHISDGLTYLFVMKLDNTEKKEIIKILSQHTKE